MNTKKTAILLGATGLTGRLLLQKLLESPLYEKVKVFTRRPTGIKHEKLSEVVCDLLQLEKQEELFTGDEVFCCIGTTLKKTPDKKLYHQIDFGIPVQAAQLCKRNKIPTLLVVSSLGADKDSFFFYNRTKGEMEAAVFEQNIENTYIFQPSLIHGEREDSRVGEKIGVLVGSILDPLLVGSLQKYKMVSGQTLANALFEVAQKGYKQKIVPAEFIQLYNG